MKALLKYGDFEAMYEVGEDPQYRIAIVKPQEKLGYSETPPDLTVIKPNKLHFIMMTPPGIGRIPVYEYESES